MTPKPYDAIIIGAGAAGLFCAAQAAQRGRRVIVLDHAKKIGEKIRISGGGRCNFTNLYTSPDNFISANPKFSISALRRFSPANFIDRVNAHGIAWHEKTLGQLFCDDSARQIVDMLINDATSQGAQIRSDCSVKSVKQEGDGYRVEIAGESLCGYSLVIATGGLSIPKIGATGFGYDIARQFGLSIIETRAGLVPLTFSPEMLSWSRDLSGLSLEAEVKNGKRGFREGCLFTHRGLSGPSILQISNYWRVGEQLHLNLLPDINASEALLKAKDTSGQLALSTVMAQYLPKRLARALSEYHQWNAKLAEMSDKNLQKAGHTLNHWPVSPTGTEGYRTAEVTIGGVDTNALSSQTMMAKSVPGLYFIGEVMDVTGWLGGYNFQWAWASGYAAGQSV